MPKRFVKESIKTSKTLRKLTDGAFRTFMHLVVTQDDYGRFYGELEVLRSSLYPFGDRPAKKFSNEIQELVNAGLLHFYSVGEREYCRLTTFIEHQGPPRAQNSKFSPPNASIENKGDSNCMHLHADSLVSESVSESVSEFDIVQARQVPLPAPDPDPMTLRSAAKQKEMAQDSVGPEIKQSASSWPEAHRDIYQFLTTQKHLDCDMKAFGLLDFEWWEKVSESLGGAFSLGLLRREFPKLALWLENNKHRKHLTQRGARARVHNWLQRAVEGGFSAPNRR